VKWGKKVTRDEVEARPNNNIPAAHWESKSLIGREKKEKKLKKTKIGGKGNLLGQHARPPESRASERTRTLGEPETALPAINFLPKLKKEENCGTTSYGHRNTIEIGSHRSAREGIGEVLYFYNKLFHKNGQP